MVEVRAHGEACVRGLSATQPSRARQPCVNIGDSEREREHLPRWSRCVHMARRVCVASAPRSLRVHVSRA
jgi:hypothetical protein